MDASDRLLKVPEVAARLGVHRDTVFEWLREHKMPGIKLQGGWRIRERDLAAWLAAQTTGREGPQPTEP